MNEIATMNPALKVKPVKAMPAIVRAVHLSGGSRKGSTPDQCKKGNGIHRMLNVKNPNTDVIKLGCSPKGGGYTASVLSTLSTAASASSPGISSYSLSAATSGSEGRAA